MIVASVTEQQYTAMEFAGLPEGWLRLLALALLVGVAAAVFWLYRREARAGASATLRNWLAVVRVAALLVLALVWLEPVIATYTTRTTTARTLVLAEAWRSPTSLVTRAASASPNYSNRMITNGCASWRTATMCGCTRSASASATYLCPGTRMNGPQRVIPRRTQPRRRRWSFLRL
jgi:hypothetical protein